MSNPALTVEALFGDLNLDLGLPPKAEGDALPESFASEAEATLDLFGFTTASGLLGEAEAPGRATLPFDIPADEFAHSVGMWGDDERFSATSTVPLILDEIPPDAFPTQFNLVGSD